MTNLPADRPQRPRRQAWAEEKRLLGQLPRDESDEWEVDLEEFTPGSWTFLVVAVRDETLLNIEVCSGEPLPDELWGELTSTMRRPRSGEPRRPRQVTLRRGVFPETWPGRLRQIGIVAAMADSLAVAERTRGVAMDWMAAAEAARTADAADPSAATAGVLAACHGLPCEPGEIWEADARRSPAWVTGEGQPYRPWLTFVASRGRSSPVTMDLARERPAADALVRLIGRGIEKHGSCPERIEVVDTALAAALTEAFAGLPTTVVSCSGPLATIDQLFDSFASSIDHPEAVAPLARVPGVSLDGARAFFVAAAAYYRARPWRLLPGDAAIDVRVPGAASVPERLVHAVVIGQSGIQPGLAVYEDRAALDRARAGDERQTAAVTGLSVLFGEAFEISPADQDWIERHHFEVAGPEAWPMTIRINPGMSVRPPLAWELELLTGLLRDVPAFIAAQPPRRGWFGGWKKDPAPWTAASGWQLSWE